MPVKNIGAEKVAMLLVGESDRFILGSIEHPGSINIRVFNQRRPVSLLLETVACSKSFVNVGKDKDEMLNILCSLRNDHGIIALLHSAYGVRFILASLASIDNMSILQSANSD
ncbi:MAG: hypothetical protein L0213_05105, partial [Candidatus Dadabacteria bacterium]|nr:hypothetical protein [Candidatus Dadabacteria bacterium]